MVVICLRQLSFLAQCELVVGPHESKVKADVSFCHRCIVAGAVKAHAMHCMQRKILLTRKLNQQLNYFQLKRLSQTVAHYTWIHNWAGAGATAGEGHISTQFSI
jgi:hypothetical protein